MTEKINYKNNPLHGLSLKNLLTELEAHYGFDILFAYLNLKCFSINASIASSVKFLKKTDWAREKVEAFYLYQFKSLPRASDEQFELPPRDRVIPEGQVAGEPAEISIEDGMRLREKRMRKAEARDRGEHSSNKRDYSSKHGCSSQKNSSLSTVVRDVGDEDPWAKWR